MSDIISAGYKSPIVSPPGPTPVAPPDPATTAPPEVQAVSVVGVSLLYARQDHTHRSPTIYWPQGAGPNSNIRGNRLASNSPIGVGVVGAINLSPDTTGLTLGVTGNYSGLFAGDANEVASDYSVILGGQGNVIPAAFSNVFIGAGTSNTANGDNAAVLTGNGNFGTGTNAAVVCGEVNVAAGDRSFVGGGASNTASLDDDVVCGGAGNQANAGASGILAGSTNSVTGATSAICAGNTNSATGADGCIAAGSDNTCGGNYNFVGAGQGNNAAGTRSAIVAGENNVQNSTDGIICAGTGNTNGSLDGAIVAGDTNEINAASRCFIGAGDTNLITDGTSANASIVAGDGNTIDAGPNCTVPFGVGCSITDSTTCSAGGSLGVILNATYGVIAGGDQNTIDGSGLGTNLLYGSIGGGEGNSVVAQAGTVPGGYSAQAYIPGAMAFASGADVGEEFWSQANTLTIRGSTPGAGANESTELLPYVGLLAARAMVLKSNRSYSCILQVATIRASTGDTRSMLINASVRVDGAGAITIAAQSTVSDVGIGTAYPVTLSAGAAPTRLSVTLNTGVGNTHAVRVNARIELVEQATA